MASPARADKQRRPRGPRKLPDNLPVERVVEAAPCVCGQCGGARLRKLGEVVSKTLECEPRRWKIVERVREKFACRDCEAVTEPPAPSHAIPRGFAGPSLLAMILVGKFGDHLPLNRQADAFAREGIDLDVSTLADWVGAGAAALDPILAEIRRHVLTAERLHMDDTTVPVLAKVKTRTGRLWTYVRDDRPFGGQGPPAVLFDYTPTRHGEHPRRVLAGWTGVLQADAYSGHNALYAEGRKPGPILEAACWAHGRRDFFEIARLTKAPIAVEIVRCLDELFAIERGISGKPPDERRAARQERSKPLVAALEAYIARAIAQAVAQEQSRQTHPLHAVALGLLHPLPRRRKSLSLKQRRGARRAVRRGRTAQLDLRGIRRGRTPGGCDLFPRSNLPSQRRRSARLARGCPRTTPRSSRKARQRTDPLGMAGKP